MTKKCFWLGELYNLFALAWILACVGFGLVLWALHTDNQALFTSVGAPLWCVGLVLGLANRFVLGRYRWSLDQPRA